MREAERVRTIATEPAIYGVVLVAGLVVVVGESAEASWDVFAKVFLTVLVFWAAHVYAARSPTSATSRCPGSLSPRVSSRQDGRPSSTPGGCC